MLELLLQATSQQPSEGLFPSEAPMMTAFIGLAAADVQGTPEATVKGEGEVSAAAFDDADFDLLFGQQLQPPLTAAAPSILDDDGILVGDGDLLQDLFQLADTECSALEGPIAIDSLDGVSVEDDYSATASSPASFDDTALMSPKSSTSLPPSSPASSSSSSRSAGAGGSGGVAVGRVTKKKEANREAAYRYRLKQRLDDTTMQELSTKLQADADSLAGRVEAAESETKFLMQMCRQIFSSRKQLSMPRGLLAHE